MTNEEIAVKLTDVEARSKSNTKRIDEIERRQDDLDAMAASMARMDERQKAMDGDVKEIKADVKALTDKPAKRWDGLMDKILIALASAFVAWLLSKGA